MAPAQASTPAAVGTILATRTDKKRPPEAKWYTWLSTKGSHSNAVVIRMQKLRAITATYPVWWEKKPVAKWVTFEYLRAFSAYCSWSYGSF